ncbi:MAG: hypothetical protein N2491_13540, partial [Negativicutes bacterium]|nr:hypothetical protein [Negativicutes bacterium]
TTPALKWLFFAFLPTYKRFQSIFVLRATHTSSESFAKLPGPLPEFAPVICLPGTGKSNNVAEGKRQLLRLLVNFLPLFMLFSPPISLMMTQSIIKFRSRWR